MMRAGRASSSVAALANQAERNADARDRRLGKAA